MGKNGFLPRIKKPGFLLDLNTPQTHTHTHTHTHTTWFSTVTYSPCYTGIDHNNLPRNKNQDIVTVI